ncbi:mediator of DNA damage checkpoint protein 1 [Aulostomus maculatus]
MDATQMICDSILESDEEENEEENQNNRGQPLAKLCVLKNVHIPAAELPLFLGDNVLGRDPTCSLPLPAPSVSKQHATVSISVHRRKGHHRKVDIEALVWDLGSMNGTRKGRLKLTPNVRYALSEGDRLVVADIPCQYVGCDLESLQEDTRTPSGNKVSGRNKCVNGGIEASARSSLDLEDTRKTPGQKSCLSFERTPTQQQGTLVPESDSDSDGEKQGCRDNRRKALVSDSDSHKSSPTSSTFLSPTNKIVPESEDESPTTPSSSAKGGPYKRVSFSKEELDIDVRRQPLEKKKTLEFLDDSEEEEGKEEERATSGEMALEESRQDVLVQQRSDVSRTGQEESPVSTRATDMIPSFNMDSDTDVEAEEEGVSPVTLNTNQKVDQPADTHFNTDDDTDVDEDALDTGATSAPSSDGSSKPPCAVPPVQPEGFALDSDTDVEDADVSDTAAKPTSTADSSTSTQPKHFHFDSDTDVDEEEDGTTNTSSKPDEPPSRLGFKPIESESAPGPLSLHPDSDTDDEVIPAAAASEPPVVSAVTDLRNATDAGADNSDTDVEEDCPAVMPAAVSTLSVPPDTDEAESSVLPAGVGNNLAEPGLDSDTDVEDEGVDLGEVGKNQIPDLPRENTPGFKAPLLQHCSTPVQLSEGHVEEMETQAFFSPSQGPCRRPLTSAALPAPCSESLEDEDFFVAETQSFVPQNRICQSSGDENDQQPSREGSFQLGLSDSSHLPCQAQALAMESTQAFADLEETQAYSAISTADRSPLGHDSNLEATQVYGTEEEPASCQKMSAKEAQEDLALQETQAYIPLPLSDLEDEIEDDGIKNSITAKTQPFDLPTLSVPTLGETHLVCAVEEEERSAPVSSVQPEHGEAAFTHERPLSEALSVAETQSMCASDGEHLMPGPSKRKAKSLQLEEETQPMSSSDFCAVGTQPIDVRSDETTSGNEETEEDSIPVLRKRKAKMLKYEEETQNLQTFIDQTQPMDTCEGEESNNEDSFPGPWKSKKAKQLRIEDEESQTLVNSEISAAETQPMDTHEDDDEDDVDEDPTLGGRKRKVKLLHFEEEKQSRTSCVEIDQTQPMVALEDGESDDEDSMPGPGKRKAEQLPLEEEETQPITNSEAAALQSQPVGTKTARQPHKGKDKQSEAGTSGIGVRGTRGTRAKLREEEEPAKGSPSPKRRTRGNKLVTTAKGRRGKSRAVESEEEEEVEQVQPARGRKSMKHRRGEEEKRLQVEENEEDGNTSRTKEQQEERKIIEQKAMTLEKAEQQETESQLKKKEQEKIEEERLREEKERVERIQGEKEQLLLEKNEKERREHENKEREERARLEREENERIQRERKKQEEKERLEAAERAAEEQGKCDKEKMDQEHQARLERQAKEREELAKEKEAAEKQRKVQQEKKEDITNLDVPARGHRPARRTVATLAKTKPEQDSVPSATDDVPARRTRSRSNSSNSVSSERSASSVSTQGSRGRGRGASKSGGPGQAATPRGSNRRRTTPGQGETTQQNSKNVSPPGTLGTSSSSTPFRTEISCSSSSSQNRGRGGKQQGRGRRTEPVPDSIPLINSQNDKTSAPKPSARSRKSEVSSNQERTDSQQASTTRGRRRANVNEPEPTAVDEQEQSNQRDVHASEDSTLLNRNVTGRGQKMELSETVEAPGGLVSDDAKGKRKGRKRELEANAEEAQTKPAQVEAKDDIPAPVQAKRRGRAVGGQGKDAEESPSETTEEEVVVRKARGRPSVGQKKKKEEQEGSGTTDSCINANTEISEPQTPVSASRKRGAPVSSSRVAKTPRSSSTSPVTTSRIRAASLVFKVLFTGVVDEAGERVLARLGGSMAKGVADMNCLVTDKVRRTVKFLCAVAKGVPVVTPHWLEKSGKAGSFLPPNAFLVNDPEQESKFNFSLEESLKVASSQPLLQGYEIHITKSVKPEPVHMKDIISCSGATFLPKMPSSPKPQTVVISCEEDWPLCCPAVSASLPVVSAEFLLSGILQQKLDFQTHKLCGPATNPVPAAGRGRGRKKT